MWKKRESNDKDILRLDKIKKQCQEEGRRGSGVGADLAAVRRNLSGRCSERGESVVDVQDPWAGQESAMCSLEDFVNPSECKSELDKNEISSSWRRTALKTWSVSWNCRVCWIREKLMTSGCVLNFYKKEGCVESESNTR